MGNCFTFESDLYEPDEVHHKPRGSPPNTKNNNNVKNSSAYRATAPMPRDVEDLRKMSGSYDVTVFTYNEMRIATKNFRPDQILGEGGFGFVYKGMIDENVRVGFTSTPVAIKVLNPDGYQGDREWLAEVNYLGQLRHSNLVKLVGYCCEGEHRLLVYEYMASGSLEKHLFKRVSATLSWPVRMKIALGAAKGLAYLHAAERSIIYRDFKTSNILLDKEYNAKLSDFGLAKDGPRGEQTHVSTRVVGTYGYAAPEYIMTGHLTARSDVYGFGVVLLEMLIGRKSLDKSRPSREHNLVEWARPLLKHNSKLLKIVDYRLEGQYSTSNVVKVANLAYSCLSQNPRGRPDMNQVVEILETLQEPIDPKANKFLQNGSGCVTLYEAKNISTDEKRTSHRSSSDSPRDERRTSNRNSDDKDPHEHRPAHRNSAEKDPYEHKPAQKNSAERMLDEKPAPTKNHGNKGPVEHKTENGVKSPEKPHASYRTQNSVRTFRSDAQRQQMSFKTGF